MGSSQSTSTVAQKAAKAESKESERFKEKIAELEPFLKELKNQQSAGKVKPDTWCNVMQELVSSQQKANKTLFKHLHEPIKQSEAAYLHFQQLVNTNAIKDYPERVAAAKNIYERYWKLLSETSMQLTKIMAKATVVVVDIEDYQLTRQNNGNNKKLAQRIKNCTESIKDWFSQSQTIERLAKEWNELGNDVDTEQVKFEDIAQHLRSANECSNAVWCIATGVGAVCQVVGILLLFAGCPYLACGFVFGAIGIWLGGGVYHAYCCLKSGEHPDTLRSIRFFQSTLGQIATSSLAINELCIDLSEKLVKFRPDQDAISKNMADTSDIVSINRIDTSLMNISKAMIEFNEQCSECCKEISQARKAIVKHAKSTHK